MTDDFSPRKFIDLAKRTFADTVKEELESIKEGETKEIYFHDLGHGVVDGAISSLSRSEAMALIDYLGNEEYADDGVLDKSSLDRFIITMAYECLYQEIFEDDDFQFLQSELNNEKIEPKKAKEILKEMKARGLA